jgi:hypothetical protein
MVFWLMAPVQPAPSRSSSGCLKGCLVALALILLPMILVGGYGAWFLWQGFRDDSTLAAVAQLVRHDGMAEAVLGENIQITGVEGNAFSFAPGLGTQDAYVVTLSGSRAGGQLAVDASTDHGRVHINSMILIGPNGDRYDLMHHTMSPAARPTDSI